MKLIPLAFTFIITAPFAHAAPLSFHGCKSDIVTEKFTSCPGGEGGASTPCGSQVTKWGSLSADLTIDSAAKSASASLVYAPVSGVAVKSATTCRLGNDGWMDCMSAKAVPSLGRLTISFNINGIAPGVYFADIFSENANEPVGGFQNTDTACQK
jgi:hypothetical protein